MAVRRGVTIILSLQDRFSKPLAKTKAAIEKAEREIGRAHYTINKWANNANKKFTAVASAAGKTSLAIASIAAGVGFKEAFDMETYKAQLETATGSTERAAELMKKAITMANKTPFEGGELVEATALFESMGMSSEKWLTYAGDMAGATGKDIMQAVEAIIDAQAGEWERMKEFGIKGVDDMDTLVQVMNQRFAGGMDKLSTTTKGMWSTITGVSKNSLAKIIGIMDDGSVRVGSALDLARQYMQQLADKLTQWQNDGTIEYISQKAVTAMQEFINAMKWAKDHANVLIPVLSALVGMFVAFNIISTIVNLWKQYKAIAVGVTAAQGALNFAMTANPIGILIVAIGALIAIGVALWMNWDTVKAKAQELWEKVKIVFNGIKSAVVGAFDAVKAKVNSVIDGIVGKIQALYEKIQNIPIIGSMTTTAVKGFNVLTDKITGNTSSIPGHATGTSFFRGGIGRINEGNRGELVQLPSGTKIFPHTKTKQMMGTQNTYHINITVQGGADPHETGRIIADEIIKALDVA